VTPEQGRIIATALKDVKLKHLNIDRLRFEDNGALEEIVSACSGVKDLEATYIYNSEMSADQFCARLAALLQNPSALLQSLTIYEHEADLEICLEEFATSLVGNTKLRSLDISAASNYFDPVDAFDNLLCDSSSLTNICSSNHTLNTMEKSCDLSSRTQVCLKLNRNLNKNKVIQNKIMRFYFVGDFDLAPFASMPLSVLVKVMSVGEKTRKKKTAIFELLRGIPELCNVSSRSVKLGLGKKNLVDHSMGFKRQKVHK
jgi:hypothetical protein